MPKKLISNSRCKCNSEMLQLFPYDQTQEIFSETLFLQYLYP